MVVLWGTIPPQSRRPKAAWVVPTECRWSEMSAIQAPKVVLAAPGEAPVFIKFPTNFGVGQWQ